ncbi:hypothetical protein PO124_18550 [Bacillus licheniformis]|nr:hypothetical protein [Bacillus licheniformis]
MPEEERSAFIAENGKSTKRHRHLPACFRNDCRRDHSGRLAANGTHQTAECIYDQIHDIYGTEASCLSRLKANETKGGNGMGEKRFGSLIRNL